MSRNCTIPVILSVQNSNCPNWSNIAWDLVDIQVSPPTNNSLVYSFSGANVSVQETNDNLASNGYSIQWAAGVASGSLTYTGPGCACKVVISGSITGTYDPGSVGAGFNITQDNVQIATYQFVQGSNNTTILFNVAAGTNSVIRIGNGIGVFFPRFFGSLNNLGANTTNLSLLFANQ